MPPPPLLNEWGGFYPVLPKGYEYVFLPKPPPPKPPPAVAQQQLPQQPAVASQDDPPPGNLIQRLIIDSESESESESESNAGMPCLESESDADADILQEAYEAAAAAMRGLREAPFEKPPPPPPPFAQLNTWGSRLGQFAPVVAESVSNNTA
jgi:hypothetical protein